MQYHFTTRLQTCLFYGNNFFYIIKLTFSGILEDVLKGRCFDEAIDKSLGARLK